MMAIRSRARSALQAVLKHLAWSVVIAGLAATLVFGLWYPTPYHVLAGGLTLFGILVAVDVVSGPLLTLVVFDPKKPRRVLTRDIAGIVLLQFAGLAYGLYSVAQARPVFLAYEGNRFRLVSMADIDEAQLGKAPPEFQVPGFHGPRLIGARLAQADAPDFQNSVMLSMQGLHPAFRPERWVAYASMAPEVKAVLQPMALLKKKHPGMQAEIDATLAKHALTNESAGYLPLDAEKATPVNWVVIVERSSGQPKAFMPLDGW